MLSGITRKSKMRSTSLWFTESCNSQCLSHFAAPFIVGAETSITGTCVFNLQLHLFFSLSLLFLSSLFSFSSLFIFLSLFIFISVSFHLCLLSSSLSLHTETELNQTNDSTNEERSCTSQERAINLSVHLAVSKPDEFFPCCVK